MGNYLETNGGHTNLEKIGKEARRYHMLRNEWRKDFLYTKALVNSEYMIQSEFKIGDGKKSQQET